MFSFSFETKKKVEKFSLPFLVEISYENEK